MPIALPDELVDRLRAADQAHVLQFWDELDDVGRGRLLDQLRDIDLPLIGKLVAGEDEKPDFVSMANRALPPPAVRKDGTGAAWGAADATRAGQQALAAGRVGAVIVAGGQGTRLGFDQPKGMFPIGPLSGRTLFQFFADKILATQARYGVEIPLYLMTSPLTHEETERYWRENGYLGLRPENVIIFCQGTMPAVDAQTGKLLLSAKDSLSLSPDGHGGTVRALGLAGCYEDAAARGIDIFSYIQVDNPLASLCDPDLIGHHLMAGSEMTTQVVRKRYPEEKVGNVVMIDGALRIIEYSDLPAEAATKLDEDGNLLLWAGNIAVHVLDVGFLRRANASADALPFHRAHKVTPYLDGEGKTIQPTSPNSIKFERFIFDLLPAAENGFVVEADPDTSFAPVKNGDGAAHDTPTSTRQMICRLHRQMLESCGVQVDPGVRVEINARYALDLKELGDKTPAGTSCHEDRYFGP
jgi:UDP-N-acetylglucosamine/UDP-N-acetylgalactosamine diphosphorylase